MQAPPADVVGVVVNTNIEHARGTVRSVPEGGISVRFGINLGVIGLITIF